MSIKKAFFKFENSLHFYLSMKKMNKRTWLVFLVQYWSFFWRNDAWKTFFDLNKNVQERKLWSLSRMEAFVKLTCVTTHSCFKRKDSLTTFHYSMFRQVLYSLEKHDMKIHPFQFQMWFFSFIFSFQSQTVTKENGS